MGFIQEVLVRVVSTIIIIVLIALAIYFGFGYLKFKTINILGMII